MDVLGPPGSNPTRSNDDPPAALDPTAHLGLGDRFVGAEAGEAAGPLRRTVGGVLGPALALVLLLAPMPLAAEQQRLAAVLALVVVWWVSEVVPIPITGLFGLGLCALLGVAPAAAIFGSFASPTIFLFIGSFMIARAMTVHGLDRRFAFRILALPGVAESTTRTIVAFGLVAASLSAVISNTATAAMLLPIGVGVVRVFDGLLRSNAEAATAPERPRSKNLTVALMLMIAYGASVGGLLTPIGSPPNLLGRQFIRDATGLQIDFLTWTAMAAPIVVVMFAALAVILIGLNPPEVRRIPGVRAFLEAERARLGPISAAEGATLAAFGAAVVGWLAPGLAGLALGEGSSLAIFLRERLDEGVVAILAASLLFLIPLDRTLRRFPLAWPEAARIDWGTILLFGSGITFGTLLTKTGLAAVLGEGLAAALGAPSLLVVTLLAVGSAILISEAASNTASVGIIVPIVIPIATAAGLDPVVPALGAVFGASYGFMLPVSTPPNAIVYGTGLVPLPRMIGAGAVFDAAGLGIISLGVTIMTVLVGLR
jgi:sodium-dependent dicarboxylate transporter 2/3/5